MIARDREGELVAPFVLFFMIISVYEIVKVQAIVSIHKWGAQNTNYNTPQ